MQYISAREFATKWDISQRRVATLCGENRIEGAQFVGNMWIIPSMATKPIDARTLKSKVVKAKPFVKWAGGKTQLIETIYENLPQGMGESITKYAEPMVGGGALMFELLQKYQFKEIFICDVNKELINTYRMIRDNVNGLINTLAIMQEQYYGCSDEDRKELYYEYRDEYNKLIISDKEYNRLKQAALFIFINKTCFNGLYRVNKKGLYNVPIGSYKKPMICDDDNLMEVSKLLKDVIIETGDYTACEKFIDDKTFVYFDPPYRPLNKTASFNDYTENGFNDKSQQELAEFYGVLCGKNAKVMLSNSDPKNTDENDEFFDELYKEYKIQRVQANRMINSSGAKRGKVTELLITNY